MGAVIATIPDPQGTPSVATIPLAEFPDNFNRKDEFNLALLSYADNIGLDPQDLQPMTGQQLGAGAQSVVLDEKSKGRGLNAWRQQWTHGMNNWVIPDLTTFLFVEKDYRDRMNQAQADAAVEQYVSDSVVKGILSAPQGLQKLVDENIYPKEFLPVDQTPNTNLSDTEKPEEGEVEQPNAAPSARTGRSRRTG